VRQLFGEGLLQSAHWHQFAMTAHSPVGLNPEKYKVIRTGPEFKGFANNDLYHEDPTGAKHEKYSEGLKKALYNYMHLNGLDFPLQKFFAFPVPKTTVNPNLISGYIKSVMPDPIDTPGYKIFLNNLSIQKGKTKGTECEVEFTTTFGMRTIEVPVIFAEYLEDHKHDMQLITGKGIPIAEVVSLLSEKLNVSEEKLMRQPWWKDFRATASKVIRM
jgi:hypothetical protein